MMKKMREDRLSSISTFLIFNTITPKEIHRNIFHITSTTFQTFVSINILIFLLNNRSLSVITQCNAGRAG